MRRSVLRVRQNSQETCVLKAENSPLFGLRREANNLRSASWADGDAFGVKNAAPRRQS
jgi:hypothetical protein